MSESLENIQERERQQQLDWLKEWIKSGQAEIFEPKIFDLDHGTRVYSAIRYAESLLSWINKDSNKLAQDYFGKSFSCWDALNNLYRFVVLEEEPIITQRWLMHVKSMEVRDGRN